MADILALRRRSAATVAAQPSTDLAELIRTTGLTGLVHQASEHPVAPVVGGVPRGHTADDRVLPVLPELRALLPAGGLRRGTTVAIPRGSGGTSPMSLLIALLTGASRAGSWCAAVGVPMLGVVAAAEAGVDLSRLALVPNPGPEWTTVVAALLDGFDIVVAAPPGPVLSTVAGRLAARARQRGNVLVSFGPWDRADLTLESTGGEWQGLGQGFGRLRRRRLTIVAGGRGAAVRRRQVHLWLPTVTGGVLDAAATPIYLAPVREAG